MNELIILLSVVVYFGGVVLFYKMFGKLGLYGWTVLMTILANIEALILVNAFGLEMTLGNVAFASTFLVTDVLAEKYGRKAANTAVKMGILSSVMFVAMSLMITNIVPSANDFAYPSVSILFGFMPRLVLASLSVYFLVQFLDIKLYEKWRAFTTKHLFKGDIEKGLWIRNNGSTAISQLFNAFLFTFVAYYGVFPIAALWQVFGTMYMVYMATSLLDTPFAYICKKIKPLND